MASTESCIPPGFRFHPTDEELVGYYLKKKVLSQKIDFNVIKDIDLYRIEPWDLRERCRFGYEEQNEWYFFSYKDRKYPTGTRTNRATMAGFWKATGRDKSVYDKMKLIGMRKTLVFYKGRAPNGQKTDWIMHEYRLESEENGSSQEEGWVVCRAFKKRPSCQSRSSGSSERWASSRYNLLYDEPSGISSIIDPADHNNIYNSRQTTQEAAVCKKETELLGNMNLIMHWDDHMNNILQLPQLESPSVLSLAKCHRGSLTSSLCLENNVIVEEEDQEDEQQQQKVTDWRALDKFVASQLSHEEERNNNNNNNNNNIANDNDGEGPSNFGADDDDHDNNADMALLLLQSGREDGYKLDGMLSSTGSDFDIGICI